MRLALLDWIIIAASLLVCFVPSLFFGKRAGRSTSEFFASGRSVPWWLAGLSMVATTFSSDTPNLVTDIVRRNGVAGNWVWWAFVLTGVATVFFYARLWRRSGVLTDLEFYEIRYSGRAAGAVRGFRAVYLGLFFNCMILATVNLAACKIAGVLFGLPRWQTLAALGCLNVVFAAHSGLWGVLVIDMIQFFIKMTAVIAAAVFAVRLPQVGGLHGLVEKLSAHPGPGGIHYLNLLPDFRNHLDMAVAVFIVPIAVQWWAVWYPGAEPGGGSYIAQRMLASKSEKDSLGAVLFFNVAHYVLRPWPWILVGLASILVYPQLSDIQRAFPHLDPSLLGHDIAYPAMLVFLPAGFIGLMVGGLIAANSSTVLTHLNWGASYLVHDFYRRFLRKDAGERHYVAAGRVVTVGLFLAAAGLVYLLDTAKDAFDIILQVGAGTGLLYLVRWFWWRVNAWCEIAAMAASFTVSVVFLVLKRNGVALPAHAALLITVAFTTVCWMLFAWFGPATDRRTLVEFYRKVKPAGPGWKRIRAEAGVPEAETRSEGGDIPVALLGWLAGCSTIWSALFTVGNFLYGRWAWGFGLLAWFILSGTVLVRCLNGIWRKS
jgi:solute:Na+ symporter, SSS family